jgi:hypothetical protein
MIERKSEERFFALYGQHVLEQHGPPGPPRLDDGPAVRLSALFSFEKTKPEEWELGEVRVCRHIADGTYPPARQLLTWRAFPDGPEILGNYRQHLLICIHCYCVLNDFACLRVRGRPVKKEPKPKGGKHGPGRTTGDDRAPRASHKKRGGRNRRS